MSHDHETIVIDSDKHFVIDPVTRAITTESPKLKLMQYDHRSERFTFEIPKTIEGHDMTLCNKIRIHYLNTGSSDRHADVHEVADMQVSKDDPEKLLFSWLIERTATQFAGTLSFAVRFYCILDDSTVDYSWGTDIFNNITVSNGMENTEQVVEDYSDLIASIQKEIADLKLNGVGGTKDYSALTNKPSIGGVELVGDKTLDDIGAQPKGAYLTKESDPTVPSWAKNSTKPIYTATEVGADPTGTAQNKVSAHNTAGDAHNDIRLLVQGLTDRLNTLADSDDDTLDQMSEIVAYIKSNKSLIDGITTGKVNVVDIVNNLTTNASNKPLSAAQGVALKALIDGITTTSDNWELLVDSTVEEDCVKITFDQDMDGSPFDLKKVCIIVNYAVSEEITSVNKVSLSFDSRYTDPHSLGMFGIGVPPKAGDKGRVVVVMAELINDRVMYTESRQSTNTTTVKDNAVHVTNYNAVDYVPFVKTQDRINCVIIGSYQTFIAAGTVIRIYGIRK